MNMHPPKNALKFLRWFCREDYVEEIEGDLTEVFEKQYGQSSRKARWNFTWSVLDYFRPEFIKSLRSNSINPFDMFRHNFLISLRNFKRHKSSFLINLTGLSTGLACSLFIYLWISDELNVDRFNDKDHQLFQVMQNFSRAAGITTGDYTQGPLAAALAQEMPEVEYATTVVPPYWFPNKGVISFGDAHLQASPQFVSRDYFNVFTCHVIQGNKNNVLPDKNSVVISEDLAIKLFHTTENIIGKTIQWNHQDLTDNYSITGVFENLPANASAPFDLLFNFEAFQFKRPGMKEWGNNDPCTYLILRENTPIDGFSKKIAGFIKTKDPKAASTLFVRPFSDKYLHGNYENGLPSGGRIFYVRLLSIIGFFILVIACINFMNLSTAKATRRIKEVGVKKAIGAARTTLIWQYLSESALVSFLSLLLAVGIVFVLLPQFNTITGKTLFLNFDSTLVTGLGLVLLITSVLAGSYPALYLSSFNPAAVLKGKLNTSIGELFARQGLVVFQFAVSVILIVAVLVVYKQMEYIQNKNLGYKKENIITFEMEGQPLDKLETFHSEIKKIPGVINAGTYYHNLTGDHGSIELSWEGKTPDQHMDFANLEVGYDFIETMDIEFKEGHSFSKEIKPESQIVLNEAAIDVMGLKNPIGKTIRFWGYERQIVGVTRNFNFESLHEAVKPCFFQVYPVMFNFVVKIQGGTEQRTIQQIHQLHNTYASGYPFDYKFLDENYRNLYVSEQRVSVLSRYFAGIAILISCLGLFGLAAFTAEKRLKEIGIRKVLGSSELGIVYLLSGDFTKTVIVSIVIALPVSYFMTKHWLDSFAFRVDLEWWYFIGAGLGALIIAWITVGMHTVKAARVNPTQCLKVE